MTGSAAARPAGVGVGGGGGEFVSFPFYGPWGTWYPYMGAWGWDYGFMTYNPWRFGATRWFWGPYGLWYDPFTYYWDPYEPGYSRGVRETPAKKTTGSLRIIANIDSAKVYVDNALVGLVGEFDGLGNHLEIEGGRHTLELRADGYQTASQEVNVKAGSTRTIRLKLQEKKF